MIRHKFHILGHFNTIHTHAEVFIPALLFQDGLMLARETGRPPDSAHSPAAGALARSSPHQNRTLALAAAFPDRAPDLSPRPPCSRRVTPKKLPETGDRSASPCAGASPAPAGTSAPRSRPPSRKIVEAACMSGGVPASLLGSPGGKEAPATRVRAHVASSQMRETAPQPAGAGCRRVAASCELAHGHTFIPSSAGTAAPHGGAPEGSAASSCTYGSGLGAPCLHGADWRRWQQLWQGPQPGQQQQQQLQPHAKP
jgi:hypothetical protein